MATKKKAIRESVVSLLVLGVLTMFSATGYLKEMSPASTRSLTVLNPAPAADRRTSTQAIAESYGRLPLIFEANQGQTDPSVKFVSRGSGYNLYLTPTEAVLTLRNEKSKPKTIEHQPAGLVGTLDSRDRLHKERVPPEMTTVRMKLVGGCANAEVAGVEQQSAKVNYFIGNDPKKWRTDVPTYARVQYKDVYRGVNLVYHGQQRQLEYDFVIKPGADPNQIRLGFEGAKKMRIDESGDLVLTTKSGELRQHRPVVYQEVAGNRTKIAGNYVMKGHSEVGFEIGTYDMSQALTIDPTLAYSTYLGGTQLDVGNGIAVDSSGNAYVTGRTESLNFPTTPGSFQTVYGGNSQDDVFVTKLNATGNALIFSTYLGGGSFDEGFDVAVDSSSSAYVTGNTKSTNFPTTPGAFQTSLGGGPNLGDVFVTKFSAAGDALLYSTYIGANGDDRGRGIAIDAAGNAFVTGDTGNVVANLFPTVNALQATPGSTQSDGFLTEVNPFGSALLYSTYLGGNKFDQGTDVAVDWTGKAYVTGATQSTNFPIANAFQSTLSSAFLDAFVVKIDPTLTGGASLIYSTFLGGSLEEQGHGIAVNAAGNAYVTGHSASTNFPTTSGAFQTGFGGGFDDAFVVELAPAGNALVYSTYVGGSGADEAQDITLDASENAYIVGNTGSSNFPVATPFQPVRGGGSDAFVSRLNATGSALLQSSYFGGSGSEVGNGIALDNAGSIYIAGYTGSSDLPIVSAVQTTFGGINDAFVAKISEVVCASNLSISGTVPDFCEGISQAISLMLNGTNLSGSTVIWSLSGSSSNPNLGSGTNLNITLSGLVAGGYIITATATNPNCPDASASISFTVKPTPTVTISGAPAGSVCPGTVINLTANVTPAGGTLTFSWTKNGSPFGTASTITDTPGSGSNTYQVTVTRDGCTANAQVSISVNDAQAPAINCPGNITKSTDPGQCSSVVTYANATATDNCSGVGTPSCTPASGSSFPKGVTSVTCTVSDANGNNASCTFTVTVNDTENPTVTCPANITKTTDLNQCSAVATYATPTASDNCPNVGTVTCNPPSGSAFAKGATTVNCTVNDAAGNTASCTFTVTVNDTENPTVTCPANITKTTDLNQCSAVATYATPTASDNCPNVETVTCNPPSGSAFAKGVTTVNCTVNDAAGNTAPCQFTVTVNDTQAPTINCPVNITKSTDPGQCSAVTTYAAPSTSDNCPGVAAPVCNPPSGSTFPKGATTVTCTVADASGNQSSCSFTVTVNDNQAPTITCPANQTANSSGGSVPVSYPAPTASDNCPSVTVVCNPTSGSSFSPGTTTVNCTATDASGNTAPCSFTVTVEVCTITCPANITRSNDANQCGAVATYPAPATTASCGTVTCSPASGSFFSIGTSTVTCTTTAGPGCTFTVTVNDLQAPTLTCPSSITTGTAPNQCFSVVNYITNSGDNCPGVSTVCNPPSGSTFPKGTTAVNCTATDGSGNTAACAFAVTVVDSQPPTIACPANQSATATTGQASTVVSFASPAVTDNCPGASVVCSPPSGSTFLLGVTTVTCTATDASANQATCTFKVAVSSTLLAIADSFLRDGADNTNEGANERLRIQSSGHNRVLARFNLTGIPTAGLQSATLVLNIADNSDNWGSSGRLVDAHRLLADWTEGNGRNDVMVGGGPGFRGTGEGVTWKCAKDTNINNQNDDCTTPWNGGTFAAATAPAALHANNQTGAVTWDVTADVQAGANNGWLIKKQTEGQNGQVRYYSREGAALAGNASLAPRLVLVYSTPPPSGPRAYVTNYGDDTVAVIDTATNTVVATVPVGDDPYFVALNPAGTRAYVTNSAGTTVSVIDTTTDSVVATVTVGSAPNSVAVNSAGTRTYVVNFGSGTVSVIDTANNSVVATVPMGSGPGGPGGLAVNPSGTRAYVGGVGGTTVSVIDTATNTVVATVPVGPGPGGLAVNPSGTLVYVANWNSNTVSVIDTGANSVVSTLTVGLNPHSVSINSAGTRAYVANYGSNNVSVIDTATGLVVATVTVGSQPYDVAVNPAGTRVYVPNLFSNTVSVIDTATNTVVATVPVGPNPTGVAVK